MYGDKSEMGELLSEMEQAICCNFAKAMKDRELTQGMVGLVLDVPYQQVAKYMKGKNRITAGKLWMFSKAFGVPMNELMKMKSDRCPPP